MSVRVLIVDDEKSIVKGLKYALEADGMQTDAAYDGEEALEKIETGEFDLILLDMMLPKIHLMINFLKSIMRQDLALFLQKKP